jgi:DNA-binding response OmpR family regulator
MIRCELHAGKELRSAQQLLAAPPVLGFSFFLPQPRDIVRHPGPQAAREKGVVLAFGDHRLDIARRELRRGAELIDLEPKVFDLLVFLVQNRDRVVTKDDLLQGVRGGCIVSESAITTRINAVRRVLGDDGAPQRLRA